MKNRKKVLLTILSLILITLFTIPVGALSENDTSYSKYACGLNPTVEEDLLKFDEYIIDNTRYAVPTSVDLSQSNAFPPIGNQGNIGSCGSWATAYYQFGYQVANMYNWDAKHDLSKCFSPKFAYNIAKNDSGSSSFLENYTVLKNCGAVRYSEFTPSSTYSESEVNQWCIDTDKLTNALRNRVSISGYNEIFNPQIPLSYALITSPYSEYLNMMKHLLYTDHIITIGTVFGSSDEITIGGTTFTGNTNWQFDLANNGDIVCTQCVAPSNAQENHALAVVGYDDDIWYDYNNNGLQEDSELGAFKIANSWSEDYCNDGFVWVMYDALNKVSANLTPNNNRREAFLDYRYYYIEVGSYDFDLTAQVTVSHNSRQDLSICLGINSLVGVTPSQSTQTLFMTHGGSYPIEGINLSPTATIPFDYGTLINGTRTRKCYYLEFADCLLNNYGATISEVQFIDKTGQIIIDDTTQSYLNSSQIHPYSGLSQPDVESRRYRIGMRGDVDNNGTIDSIDVVMIQRSLSNLIELSDDDLRTADINNDGNVDSVDVTILQYYLAHLSISGVVSNGEFINGIFVDLDKEM